MDVYVERDEKVGGAEPGTLPEAEVHAVVGAHAPPGEEEETLARRPAARVGYEKGARAPAIRRDAAAVGEEGVAKRREAVPERLGRDGGAGDHGAQAPVAAADAGRGGEEPREVFAPGPAVRDVGEPSGQGGGEGHRRPRGVGAERLEDLRQCAVDRGHATVRQASGQEGGHLAIPGVGVPPRPAERIRVEPTQVVARA